MERRFNAFEGVFTPCLLSILGVIMYLRLGWVVGHVGLVGALSIIVLANVITLSTALSMSSIISNIRIGDGGAYSIITKSLGVEAGGAIGIPLFISQSISVAFYIAGFAECWHFVYPHHSVVIVSIMIWFVVVLITYLSAKLAFKIQYVIMGIIVASLVSIIFGTTGVQLDEVVVNQGELQNFWSVFAVFFPAVTGILAGAALSGELKNPKIDIPRGTLIAIAVSFVIYIFLALLFSFKVPPAELRNNYYVAIDLGRWPMVVVAGIMGATLSSALSMAVGSPRILLALSKHSIVPFSKTFKKINKKGEPAAAIIVTALIAFATILLGSLDQIASLLTMFFLITYGIINLVVFIEQSIGIVSFRPAFKVPRIIPLLGGIGCIVVMFIIDVRFSLISFLVIAFIYYILLKREARIYSPDIRSGALVYLAENFAKAASKLPYYPKIWKPNLIVPVENYEEFAQVIPFIRNIVYPSGRISAFEVIGKKENSREEKAKELDALLTPLKEEGIFVESTVVKALDHLAGTSTVMQTMTGTFFPPNTLFFSLDNASHNDKFAYEVIEQASEEGLGVIALIFDPKLGFIQERIVNLWVRRESPNINLAVLIALQLQRNWNGTVNIVQVVEMQKEKVEAEQYLLKLKELLRLPEDMGITIIVGDFKKAVTEAPAADLNIFGMQEQQNIAKIREISREIKTSVLFIKDSKNESALA